MRWLRNMLTSFNYLVSSYTIVTYLFCYWPSSIHWVIGFMTLSLPVLWVGHLFLLLLGILIGARKSVRLSVIVLLLSFPFWARTFQLNGKNSVEKSAGTFRLVNFNIHNLGFYSRGRGEQSLLSAAGRDWLSETAPDILCFQEAYQSKSRGYDLAATLKKAGYRYFVFAGGRKNAAPEGKHGLAVFSKFPVTEVREEIFGEQNGILAVSVAAGADTVTLINVHLHSMTLKLERLVKQKKLEGLKWESRLTFRRIKEGFVRRKRQMDHVEKFIDESGHPVLVCGDFNEVPYGYAYGKLNERLRNAFEEGGRGFGFTFNQLPYFIRIDNQFYDPERIELSGFKTGNDVLFSDHYPLIGDYRLK